MNFNQDTAETPMRAPSAAPGQRGGGADWERIFEDPERGLISVIARARSVDTIREQVTGIVATLFTRNGDEPRREALTKLLNEITDLSTVEDGHHDPLEVVRVRTVKLLRGIKNDRIARNKLSTNDKVVTGDAADHRDRRGASPEILDVALDDTDDDWSPAPGGGKGEYESVQAAFSDAFCEIMADRFAVMRGEIETKNQIRGRLPFLLSRRFAERYLRIVRQHILPTVYVRCRKIVAHLEQESPGAWHARVHGVLTESANRMLLWEAWRSAWLERTTQMPMPEKPGNQPIPHHGRRVTTGDSARKPSTEEWQRQCDAIKRQNAHAANVWREMTVLADGYHAPLDQDNRLLMELFGRSAGGIADHISALLEIATRGTAAAKLFGAYQRGKSIDVALLAACYQHPTVLLDGDRPMLREFVRNYGRRQKLETLPLTSRYLSDRM